MKEKYEVVMKYALVSLILTANVCLAQSRREIPTYRHEVDNYHMTMVEQPKQRLTKNWAFIVDTSHSMNQDRVEKAQKAFNIATQDPTDELNFCMFTFNDRGTDRFRDWSKASPEEFARAHDWARKRWQRGTLSYAGDAFRKALRLRQRELTIIVISDGGFTEGYNSIKTIIDDGQKWRRDNGLGNAIIACIGIQNLYYRSGGKEPDSINQRWLYDIGMDNYGGYSYIHQGLGPVNPIRRELASENKKSVKVTIKSDSKSNSSPAKPNRQVKPDKPTPAIPLKPIKSK